MSKLTTLALAAGAYTLGTRAGRGRYDQMTGAVRSLRRPTSSRPGAVWTPDPTPSGSESTSTSVSEQSASKQTVRTGPQVP